MWITINDSSPKIRSITTSFFSDGTDGKDEFILSCDDGNECTEEGCKDVNYDNRPAHGDEKKHEKRICCCKGDR